MKVDIETEKNIKAYFDQIKDVDGLLKLINAVNKKVYHDTKPLKIQSLTYYAYKKENSYISFLVPKKSGGNRIINAPAGGLKHIQSSLNIILQSVYKPQIPVHGFRRNRSVVTNAQLHTGKNYVYNIDLKDFFPSIHKARIEKRLQVPPFNLSGDKVEIATLISRLTTQKVFEFTNNNTDKKVVLPTEMVSALLSPKNKKALHEFKKDVDMEKYKKYAVLPQGAPTSPTISNFICDRLDRRLMGLAKRFNVKYTRYADDITFSSMHNVYQNDSEFIIEMNKIITDQNFEINPKKTRLQKRGYKQEVTGIIVNDKTNVSRRYIKQLRAMLYSLEKHGIKKAQVSFIKHYADDKGHVKEGVPSILNVLSGKLDYLKMVKSAEDSTYKKLKERFELIINPSEKSNKVTDLDIELNKKESVKKESSSNEALKCEHSPQDLVRLLKSFTQNNNALKYTTHSWEEGKFENYDDFMVQVKKEWYKIDKELKKYSKNLHAKIRNFLTHDKLGQKDKEGYIYRWGEYNVKIGWSSPEIKEWCDKGNKPKPFDYTLKDNQVFEVDRNTISTFYDVAMNVFKHEIEIKTDNNRLEKLFRDIVKKQLGFDFNVQYENLKGKDFYTDVQWLKSALTKIVEGIKKGTTHPDVIIKGIDKGNVLEIYIIQVKSIPGKTSSQLLDRKDKGDFGSIANELCSLCDWSVEAKCVDGNYRINYLKSDDSKEFEELDYEPDGFTHILRFYK